MVESGPVGRFLSYSNRESFAGKKEDGEIGMEVPYSQIPINQ